MHPTYQRLLEILQRYVSRVNAKTILQRSIADIADHGVAPTDEQLLRVAVGLRKGLALFVAEESRVEVMQLIGQACGEIADVPSSRTIAIKKEADVTRARVEARRLCEALDTTAFTVQKVTTIVSELARNIVSYTDGGEIEVSALVDGRRCVHVFARDEGRGIPNLGEVLSGTYRSRTGLGKGIFGCRKLADDFDIETSGRGTRIKAEVRL